MDYKRIWKKYTLILRITTVLLIILLFFLRWLFLENSTIQLIALVSVVGLVLILKNYLNSLLVGKLKRSLKERWVWISGMIRFNGMVSLVVKRIRSMLGLHLLPMLI